MSSFFKPASQKQPEKLSWRLIDKSLVIGRYEPQTMPPQALKHPVRIAAFDLDDTVISPTGAKFARSAQSWRWWDPSVPGRLKSLYEDGYLVVIFSNQGNVSLKSDPKTVQKDTLSLTNLKDQLTIILRQLDLPISMYGATGQDRYRKPRTGMWQEMLEDYDLQAEGAVDKGSSFYVGDAAGRAKTDKHKKDFASSDRALAANIGIRFQTPDEFFLYAAHEAFAHDFDPAEYLDRIANGAVTASFAKKSSQELVIFCGSPGAGKSSYYWQVLQPLGYERVNQDILKSVRPPITLPFMPAELQQRDRCLKKAREYLEAGESVTVGRPSQGMPSEMDADILVSDNTNADIETRKHWIQIAQDLKIPIRLIRFTAPTRLCEHNDSVRALNTNLVSAIWAAVMHHADTEHAGDSADR